MQSARTRAASRSYSPYARVRVRAKPPSSPGRRIAEAVLRIVAVTVIPVIALVGVAVELYARGHGTTTSVGGGAAAALAILTIAGASISRKLTGQARFSTLLRWVALPAVAAWCGYALFHFERANAKTAEVRSAYTSLHPILRLAVSTAILADGELVVTDASRTAADYRRMRLPVFDRTMHYRQANGWVHAIDVRTIGHGEARNTLLAWYFRAVGLRVVRHVGTADHLHVELPLSR